MRKYNFVIFISFIFLSCSKKEHSTKDVYNQKANEVINQIIKETSCDCLLEIPNQSLSEITKLETPFYDVQNDIMEKLKLNSKSSLDSLINFSRNFKLDYVALKKNNIKIVTPNDIIAVRMKNDFSVLKKCQKGIISIDKPVFDKDFKRAVINYDFPFTCNRSPVKLLEFKNGSWQIVEK